MPCINIEEHRIAEDKPLEDNAIGSFIKRLIFQSGFSFGSDLGNAWIALNIAVKSPLPGGRLTNLQVV